MNRLLPLLLLAGCATAAPPPRPEPPPELLTCPGRVASPPAPKPPRSVESVARWATAINSALVRTEANRAECARRLDSLNAWIVEH
jgi:hypothetical protein